MVQVIGGESTTMMLALRQSSLSAQGHSIAVTEAEVRRLAETGHQMAIISTAKRLGTSTGRTRCPSPRCDMVGESIPSVFVKLTGSIRIETYNPIEW